jgi:hypothetical protein
VLGFDIAVNPHLQKDRFEQRGEEMKLESQPPVSLLD